ncbi:shikimate dehydrogenase [Candidatus Dependentiae bacterium]|nr:shikimate dehydrogenase [Candidatus Dependentiae bacterium]
MIYNKICGIFGNPVSHSLSPLIHNHLFNKYNYNYEYEAFEIYDIETAVKLIRTEKMRGVSITIPFKVKVIKYLDEITDLSKKIGAVNTIINENGKLIGDNTDAYGVSQTFKKRNIFLSGKNIVILGIGGAAKSVVYSILNDFDINSLKLIARNNDKLIDFSKEILDKTGFNNITCMNFENETYSVEMEDDIIINASSAGMTPNINESLINEKKSYYNNEKIFFDVIYNPEKTLMLKTAESKGSQIINGMDMFIYQAMRQHILWTGNNKIKYEDISSILF